MTNYEGEITTPDNHNKIPMESASDPDEIFEMAVVNTSDYDDAVDKAMSTSYTVEDSDTSRYDNDVGFASCLNAKVYESKFKAAIGSTTVADDNCCLFLNHRPFAMTSEELEISLTSVLDENEINAE